MFNELGHINICPSELRFCDKRKDVSAPTFPTDEVLCLIIDTSQTNISLTEEKRYQVIRQYQELNETSQTKLMKLTESIDLLLSIPQAVLSALTQ